jgi:hypothetical protein
LRRDKSVHLGVKRMSLDLAFKTDNNSLPPPAPPSAPPLQAVLAEVPFQPSAVELAAPPRVGAPLPRLDLGPPACRTAAPDAVAERPATLSITTPPTIGIYPVRNVGTFTLDGLLKLSGPYPRRTHQEIANVKVADITELTGQVSGRTITYDVIRRNPLQTVTTTYTSQVQARAGGPGTNELTLVKVVTTSSAGEMTFAPIPAITVMQYKGEGSSWRSAGVDPTTGTAMVVQGSVEKKETVDLCGELVDSYRVVSHEQMTNAVSQYSSQTDPSDPNVYNVATQFGGLMVRQHINTTTAFTVNNVPFTLHVNFTSTNESTKPLPPGSPPPHAF